MKNIIGVFGEKNLEYSLWMTLKKFKELISDVYCIEAESLLGESINEVVRNKNTNFFVAFNLTGFDQTTLTDNISYNLLPCKQIHIITKDNLPNEKYLEKQLSISMFFYCTDAKYCQYLLEKYPDIPYLELVEEWKEQDNEESVESNAKILSNIVEEVIQMCHMK